MSTLFAWVTPAFSSGSPVDHTWITDYDNRSHPYPDIAAVKQAGASNWYCWGSFHPTGGAPGHPDGFLASANGDKQIANCLVMTNADSRNVAAARGTIFTYGVDGVCHQLANQVLYSTAGGGTPLTVKGARGYSVSTFLYGTYGLQDAAWLAKLQTCAGVDRMIIRPINPEAEMNHLPDDFEDHARQVLSDRPELLARLLALRTEVNAFAAQKTPGFFPPDAALLNARNQHLLEQAAVLLGADLFREVFGLEPGERIDLVDPTIVEQSSD
jgi:hypothetical protein